MISDTTASLKAMYAIISINLFDRIWLVVCSFALLLFLLPFSLVVFDLLRVNFELLQLRGRRSEEELTCFAYKHTARNADVAQSILRGVGHYIPPWWYSSHLGTLIAFGYDPQLQYEVEMMKAGKEDDAGCFPLSWFPSKPASTVEKSIQPHTLDSQSKEPLNILVFFPGLGLSSRSKVSQQVARVAAEAGFVTVIVGARGLEAPLSSKRPWHPGFYEDAVTTVEYLHQSYSQRGCRIFLLGYSAGSNIVHKTVLHFDQQRLSQRLGQSEKDIPVITAASCVCINYDYLGARARLEKSWIGTVYSMLMCAMCKEILQKNAHVYHSEEEEGEGVLLTQLLSKCFLLSHYDEHVALTLHGYSSLAHLQESLSMFNFDDISVPLLAMQPADDPLHMGQVRSNINLDRVITNPNVIYLEPKYGNHFGFFEGSVTEAFSNKTSYTYPPRVAVQFFQTILRHHAQQKQ